MKLIKAPDIFVPESIDDYHRTLFLGGGISGCHEWQEEAINRLSDTNLIVINPRRNDFDATNKTMEAQQIQWEFWHLRLCNVKLFWFPPETLCPITLFELGKALRDTPFLYVGADLQYRRRADLYWQQLLSLGLDFQNFGDTIERVCGWIKQDETKFSTYGQTIQRMSDYNVSSKN